MTGRLCSRRAWVVQTALSPAVIVDGDRGPALDSGRWVLQGPFGHEEGRVSEGLCAEQTLGCVGETEPLWPLDGNRRGAIPSPVWPVS